MKDFPANRARAFGMELTAEEIILPDDGAEPRAVLAGRQCVLTHGGGVAMNKVDERAIFDAGKQRMG